MDVGQGRAGGDVSGSHYLHLKSRCKPLGQTVCLVRLADRTSRSASRHGESFTVDIMSLLSVASSFSFLFLFFFLSGL